MWLAVAGAMVLGSGAAKADGVWTAKADMPTARCGLCACVVDGKIYAIGGGAPVTTVEQYDPATDVWTKKSDMHTPRVFFAASVANGKIYVIGGYGTGGAFLSSVEQYDPMTDTWTPRAPMSTARKFGASAAAGGKIYAMGGMDPSEMSTAVIEEYDPTTDTWTRKANMPTPRGTMSCSTVNGIIYAIGGGLSWDAPVRTVQAYDPATDTWTARAPMSTARQFFTTCVVNGKILAIGGCRQPYDSSEMSSVEAYDPATNTWTEMDDMPTARKAFACSAVGGRIYAIGGQPVAGWDVPLATVEEYNLAPPPPDLNGDGRVDGVDLLIMTAHWGQAYPFCDIAPIPFGDGVVDLQDVIAFAGYIGKEVTDPTLIAHWSLDETEGTVVPDNTGGNDGTIRGTPLWRPAGGMVDGALELDGMTFVTADFVLNPADPPFSVLAWIKGGTPGQAIVSQQAGANWLALDPATGTLMTELNSGGRVGAPLWSDAVVTDGNWHRVSFTWDGVNRRLYVDDILVAEDADTGLAPCTGDLNVGCGKDIAPTGCFAGLIDDVRIYNRAVKP